MTIRVSASSTLRTLMSNLRKSGEEVDTQLEKLSSGKRINRSRDDTAGLAISKKLDGYIRSQNQARRNANDGISFIQTAEGGLNEVTNILTRLRELTIQSGSDTIEDNERGHLEKEYQELVSEVDRIAEATSFNGTNVINGDGKGILNFQIGAFATDENQIGFDSDGTHVDSETIGIAGTSVASKSDALDSIKGIDEAINKVSSQRASLGALQSRLGYAVNNLEVNTINHESTRSKIEDVDVARSTAKLASANLLKLSATQALSQGIEIPKSALKLLK